MSPASASVAATGAPMAVPMAEFSETARCAVSAGNLGAVLAATTALAVCAAALLPVPRRSV